MIIIKKKKRLRASTPLPRIWPILRWCQLLFSTVMSHSVSRQIPKVEVFRNKILKSGARAATDKLILAVLSHQLTVQAAVSSTKEECEEANTRAKEKSDEKWRRVLREHLDKAAEEAAVVAAAVSKEHDAVLEETQQAFRM